MDINKRNRTDLKSYFVKNSIPTESNFAELIDGMLNQKEDGIAKLAGDPLSIEAAGDDASQQKLINFYRSFADPNPLWTLNLNPRSDPNKPATARVGFSISDGEGNPRLFVDRSTSNVGVGTNKPDQKLTVYGGELSLQTDDNSKSQGLLFQNSGGFYTWRIYRSDAGNNLADLRFASGAEANVNALKDKLVLTKDGNLGVGVQGPNNSLDIQAVNRTGNHATGRPLYVTGNIGAADTGIEFRHTNGSQGIGFGYNTIYATGTNVNQDLSLMARGQGKINIQGNLEVNGDIKVNGNDKQLWFPTDDVREFIRFGSWERYAIGVQSGTQYFRTGKNFAWYKAGAHDDGELIPGGGTVQMVIKDGNLGIGTPEPLEKLTVNEGDVKIEGGRYRRLKIVSDKYWAGIELVAREQGEAGNPHIDFTHGDLDSPNYGIRLYAPANNKFVIDGGNVGIGTATPDDQLDVAGAVRILTRSNPIRFTSAWTGFPDGATDRAEISNDTGSFKTLMIVGNKSAGLGRRVSVWDRLEVNGPLITQQRHTIKIGDPSPNGRYGNDGIRGEPNLWLDAQSTVYIKPGFQTPSGFDIAERFKPIGLIEPGQVVIFDEAEEAVKLCERAGDSRVVGIASAEAAFILGSDAEQVPIALCGRLPCYADADIAPIAIGDLLTTSPTKGHAQKVLDPGKHSGAILGKALGSLAKGKGKILVLVTLL